MERQDHSEIKNLLEILKQKAESNRSVSLATIEIRAILNYIADLKKKGE